MQASSERRDWDDLSALDPYWAVLSDPARRFGRWEMEEFLRSGRTAVAEVLAHGASFGLPLARGDALDFGCGAGRLTVALAAHFDRCLGVDVSAHMVQRARETAAGIENCSFAVLSSPDLSALQTDSFDLVVSLIVLQHVPSAESKERYIAELLRVLRPGGLVAFQLPSKIPARHRIQPRPRLYGLLRRAGVSPERLYRRWRLHPIRMSYLARARVQRVIEEAGGRILDVTETVITGGVRSSDYLATKDGR
jgi:SAM-dependent methyltransferase